MICQFLSGTRPSAVAPGAQMRSRSTLSCFCDLFLGHGGKLLDHRGGSGVGILPRLVPALEARGDELLVEVGIALQI